MNGQAAPATRPLRDGVFATAACCALVVAWWRLPAFVPRPGGDNGWIVGLHQARVAGLRFGSDVTFTYGPLAWVAVPSALSRAEVAMAVALWFAIALGFLVTLQASLRTVVSTSLAWLATVAVAATFAIELSAPPGAVTTIALITSLLYVTRTLPAGARAALPALGGIVAAVFVLTKFSSGVLVGLCAAAATASLAERRAARLAALALSGTVAVGLLWSASQGDLRHLVDYLRQSLELSGGYAGAMGLERLDYAHEYPIAAVVSLGLLVALVRLARRGVPWPFVLVLAAALWFAFRQGFIRHDGHSAHFFAAAAGLCAVLAVLQRSPSLGLLAGLSLVAQTASIGGGLVYLDPARGLRDFAQAVTLVASTAHQRRVNEGGRAELRRALGLSPELLRRLDGHSVEIEPFEDQAAWAYGWTWRPLATLQGYTAYTAALDQLNVRALRHDDTAPQTILRSDSPTTLDGRYTLWDPPRTQLEVLCRYRLAARLDGWQVLERHGDRCGPPRSLGRGRYAANQRIDVPQVDGGIVLATVVPDPSLARALAALVFKPPELDVVLDGSPRRLPWGHVGAPLVVSVVGTEDFQLAGAPVAARRLRIPYAATVAFDVVPIAP